MAKYDRRVISVQPPHAEKELEKFADYVIVSVTPVNNRLVFVLEKEKGPGRPKKENGKDE
mgnify:CR=1 FL=1